MGFFEPSVTGEGGGGHEGPLRNFVVIVPMIMKFGTVIKLHNGNEKLVTSLLVRNYDVITCILADTQA